MQKENFMMFFGISFTQLGLTTEEFLGWQFWCHHNNVLGLCVRREINLKIAKYVCRILWKVPSRGSCWDAKSSSALTSKQTKMYRATSFVLKMFESQKSYCHATYFIFFSTCHIWQNLSKCGIKIWNITSKLHIYHQTAKSHLHLRFWIYCRNPNDGRHEYL